MTSSECRRAVDEHPVAYRKVAGLSGGSAAKILVNVFRQKNGMVKKIEDPREAGATLVNAAPFSRPNVRLATRRPIPV